MSLADLVNDGSFAGNLYTLVPCPYCKGRIDSRIYATHLEHCSPPQTEAERDARDEEAMRADIEADCRPAFTEYQKRVMRENQRRFGTPIPSKEDKGGKP